MKSSIVITGFFSYGSFEKRPQLSVEAFVFRWPFRVLSSRKRAVPTPFRLSCLSLAYICGLGLCPFSKLVCDLLPRRLFHSSPKAHCWGTSQSALLGGHKGYLVPFLPQWGGTIPWALRFLVIREIDSGDWLARGYMPAHQHCELFYPPPGLPQN